ARLVALLEKASTNHPATAAPADPAALSVTTSAKHNAPTPASAASGPLEVESTVPQRGIYASSRLSERLSASYNESMTLRFTGNISIEKMSCAMERLVGRHDALRASFDESGLVMRIVPKQQIAMPVTDLSSIG